MMTVPAGRKRGVEETGAKRSAGIGWFRSKKFRVEGAPSPLFAVLSPVRREEEMGNREEERLEREKESLGRDKEWERIGVNRLEEVPKRMGKSPSTSVVSCFGLGGKGPER